MADQAKVRAGLARAESLSPEQRQEIARKAALTRWSPDLPRATHDGDVKIGDVVIYAAVLPNGKHLLSQGQFLQAIGRSRTPKGGTGAYSTVDGLPFFLHGERLQPFISDELRLSTTPIFFLSKSGQQRRVGYDAELLNQVCEVYLQLRDQSLAETGHVPRQYAHIIRACDTLTRGLARVGIVGLIDEATGYQYDRDRRALQSILDEYIGKELARWEKRFPDEFYREIFRLKGWTYDSKSSKRPMLMARITCDLVFDRIGPGLTKELKERRQEIFETTGRKTGKLHQVMTPDIGHPALQHHMSGTIFLGKAFADGEYDAFHRAMDRVAPRNNRTLPLPFPDDSISHAIGLERPSSQ